MNNLLKIVVQQRRDRASNPRLLDRKSNALPLSHRATPRSCQYSTLNISLTVGLQDRHIFRPAIDGPN